MVAPILALSGAWTTAAGAEAPLAPAYFTFTTGRSAEFIEGEVTHIDGNTTEIRGGYSAGKPVEATDPRASGLLTTVHDADAFRSGDSRFTTFTTSVRLVNEGGVYSGTGTSVSAFTSEMALADEFPRSTEMTVLTGEGGYEGLMLILGSSDDGNGEADWGVIVPTDQMPPTPDPVEPSVE
jgi:hypothetical protein